ncbi:MAG: hydrogenase maturation protease [Verrucomicrobiota bacterium]|nr:hydrogenase maturation protease [Verrucomicrobiota bacterium]MDQ6938685.1 hydrogenase maturation protease [Verrucomicrobiota bacterium]
MNILVAGIGNIFFGDDAFGCEVVRHLLQRPIPAGVTIKDFGIRSYDLAYAMMDGPDVTIFIDATSRGEPPGTLFLIEPEINNLDSASDEVVNAHSMNPVRVLQLIRSLGGQPGRLYLVGCEPALLETEDGAMGLSQPVQAAIPKAIEMIESLLRHLFSEAPATINAGTVAT